MKDLSKEILAYTLQNALEYGNADAGRVLPKLFQHGLDKKEIPLAMKEINKLPVVSGKPLYIRVEGGEE